MHFPNRRAAGQKLAEHLQQYRFQNPTVIALTRGGVPVGYEVAHGLNLPLDILVVRKVGAPGNPEYGIGAVTEEGFAWIDQDAAYSVGATPFEIEASIHENLKEVEKRVAFFHRSPHRLSIEGKTVLLVDDGLATGVSARVASQYLKSKGAKEVFITVPVASVSSINSFGEGVEVISLYTPEPFYSVGQFYEDFSQISDDEVLHLLNQSTRNAGKLDVFEEVTIPCDTVKLNGNLSIPHECHGLIIFAHGSGSGRFSPRNRHVASALNRAGFGTLLFDLLTQDEADLRENIFNIPLLADRVFKAAQWIKTKSKIKNKPLGYFGASTGAAAALWAASFKDNPIRAIVSRGGRPDLASTRLLHVSVPTLLIVGQNDIPIFELNQYASTLLQNGKLVTVAGATHLFEESGALEQVCELSIDWFKSHFKSTVKDTYRQVA